jgi:TRAP transporter TAXI family solute receptor
MALVAGEPAYEAFAGIGRPASNLKIIAAIYSSPGMFAVRGDSSARTVRDLVGKPISWGTRASGITLLGKYVMDGLGLDREKDFEPFYLDKAGDGPVMVAEGTVAAQWGAGIGWPGFTAITTAGGRLIGLTPDEITQIRAKHKFLTPITVPAGSYPGQSEPILAVGSWSYILSRTSLDNDVAYRFARALDFGHAKLVQRVEQGAETRPENTLSASPSTEQIHPGVLRYLKDTGLLSIS